MLFSSVTDEEHKTETNMAIIFSECPVFDCLVSKHYLLLVKALRNVDRPPREGLLTVAAFANRI
jgi:hypothetical protein